MFVNFSFVKKNIFKPLSFIEIISFCSNTQVSYQSPEISTFSKDTYTFDIDEDLLYSNHSE